MSKKICKIKENPEYTTYHFGDINNIANKELVCIERNFRGDCLCIAENNLIDVDNRDVLEYKELKQIDDIFDQTRNEIKKEDEININEIIEEADHPFFKILKGMI